MQKEISEISIFFIYFLKLLTEGVIENEFMHRNSRTQINYQLKTVSIDLDALII